MSHPAYLFNHAPGVVCVEGIDSVRVSACISATINKELKEASQGVLDRMQHGITGERRRLI